MQVKTPTYVRDNVVAISCGQKFTLLLTKCPPGSDGDYCNIISCHGTLASDPTVCSTKGTCDGPNNCTCQSGWGGDTCSVMTCAGKLSTDPTVCSGNGQCNVPNTCACSAGWGGSQCETPICGGKLATDPLVCGSRNGTCDAPNTCSCKTGFLGANVMIGTVDYLEGEMFMFVVEKEFVIFQMFVVVLLDQLETIVRKQPQDLLDPS